MKYTKKEQKERKNIIKKIVAQLLKTSDWHMEFGEPIDGVADYQGEVVQLKIYGVYFLRRLNNFVIVYYEHDLAPGAEPPKLESLWTTTLVAINKYLEQHLGK